MTEIKMSLKGKTIIITRALEQNNEVNGILTSLGAKVLDMPALIIGPPDDWKPLDESLTRIDEFDWLIFSSANGVKYVEQRMKKMDMSLSLKSNTIKIASVGRKTAQALKEIGAKVKFVPPKYIADSLVEYFPQAKKGLKLLIPRVQSGGRNILASSFVNGGSDVVEVPAYESKCPETIPQKTLEALDNSEVNVIAFTSGKTALHTSLLLKKYFGSNWLHRIAQVKLVSIGPQTSQSCFQNIRLVDKESEPHDLDGLINSCIEVCN